MEEVSEMRVRGREDGVCRGVVCQIIFGSENHPDLV